MIKNCKHFKCKIENCSCAFPTGAKGYNSCGCISCLNYTPTGDVNSTSCDILSKMNESEMEESKQKCGYDTKYKCLSCGAEFDSPSIYFALDGDNYDCCPNFEEYIKRI